MRLLIKIRMDFTRFQLTLKYLSGWMIFVLNFFHMVSFIPCKVSAFWTILSNFLNAKTYVLTNRGINNLLNIAKAYREAQCKVKIFQDLGYRVV
jgi:hypothetical protein